jgi:hypothetical protein
MISYRDSPGKKKVAEIGTCANPKISFIYL